jgi:hypothetical protein
LTGAIFSAVADSDVHIDGNNDFIWSTNATTTVGVGGDLGWMNGYLVPGLSGSFSDTISN